MVDFKPGVPSLVLKIEQGKSSSNLRDVVGAALVIAKANASPNPGIIEFLTEWAQMEDTKEFEIKKKSDDQAANMAANLSASQQAPPPIHSAHK